MKGLYIATAIVVAFTFAIWLLPPIFYAYEEDRLIASRVDKGIALHESKRYEEAIASFNKVIDTNPNYPDAWYYNARTLSLTKNRENMFLFLAIAIDMDDKYKAMAREDEDFKAYWDDADFIDLTK